MFDNVTLKVFGLPKDYSPSKNAKKMHRIGAHYCRYKLNNLKLIQNYDCLTICGSLAKYLQDENITSLNREKVKMSIRKLEDDIALNLKKAIICSVEFGASIITKEKPFEYLNLFENTKWLVRVEYSKSTGVETVNYTTPTGAFEFIGYDKVKEMLDKKQEIPLLFNGANVLRLEYKIRTKRGIETKFKGGLSAYNLFDEKVYRRFQMLFFTAYNGINKMGRLVYVNKSEKVTQTELTKIQAEQYRQSFPKDYRYSIQQLNEAGKLSPYTLERIRAENNGMGNDIYVSDRNDLIKELDALVYDRVTFGD